MFVGCSESFASAELVAPFPMAYVLQALARQSEEIGGAARATLEYGFLASGVRHVVVCGHYGCRGDEDAPTTPEASQAMIVARCGAIQADEQIGPLLRRARVTMQTLWFKEASHDLYVCDFEGQPARYFEDADLASMSSRLEELSA
jgi:hypothetical protein